jgi:hypothetical protein
MAWFYGRWLAGIAGSNPVGGIEVCLLRILCFVSATGRSLRQRNPAECGVSECDRGTSTMRRPRPTRAVQPRKKLIEK